MGVIHLKSEWLWTSLVLSGVLAGDWAVHVPKHPIHASRGSSVTLLCTYDFPEDSVLGGPPHKVLSEMWCRNQSFCITPTYIYHSAGIFPEPAYQGRVRYLGTTGSKNCTLQITDLRTTDSGIYVFRFITDHPVSKLPGQRGLTLQVTDGPVTSVTVISTGEIAEGSSLTLTCTSYSTSPVMNYTWFKTNGAITSLRGSGQNFSIERLSSKDSGLYTCMAQNSWGCQNATIQITIQKGSPVTFIGIVCGLALALTVITIIAAYRRHLVSRSHQSEINAHGYL
ncbi:myelin-associated glycoprotein isoform X2 [Electrophorus electricus]|uniref:myelin-associated glycoprotein isoform X2 n=1 Tax=Electrophorus electricus TaxID=8005 RepID=UPI000F09C709|nr:myelin-associated glycoprotein isoform X2 [Electrophorus electricus]